MHIIIEPHGTYAIYEQIVDQMKNAIVSGELTANEALPSIRGLAAEIGVSVITTKRAYEELEKEGLSARWRTRDSMSANITETISTKNS